MALKIDAQTTEHVYAFGKRFTNNEWKQIAEAHEQAEHFDRLQLTKKIQL